MPVFRFRASGDTSTVIENSLRLQNLAAARCEAVKYAGRLICDVGTDFWRSKEWQMTVSDDAGLTLFVLTLIGTESPAISG